MPKKFAIKYEPPTIALEYHIKSHEINYLLQINLEDQIKKSISIEEMTNWIFKMYSDIINIKTVSEKQVTLLLLRLHHFFTN
jgi:uncharacterized protein YeeX (DUF496 family)